MKRTPKPRKVFGLGIPNDSKMFDAVGHPRNANEYGRSQWSNAMGDKDGKKDKQKSQKQNRDKKQRSSLRNNRKGNQSWYCRNKNRDSVL
jgi:hypothetical protein